MVDARKHARLPGKLVFIGFGSVGQGALPLLLRHLDIRKDGVLIINADDRGAEEAAAYGVPYHVEPLTPANLRAVLDQITGTLGELERMLDAKNVVGEPMEIGGATVIPLVNMGFGFGAGAGGGGGRSNNGEQGEGGGGGGLIEVV